MGAEDLCGKTFGSLCVVSRADDYISPRGEARVMWSCVCKCGGSVTIRATNLKWKEHPNCGCMEFQSRSSANTKHGGSGTKLYKIWNGMKARCLYPSATGYALYGGRGIKVCERWMTFDNFRSDMGEPPTYNHSIDRRDSDKDYEPSNCRWATPVEQARNKRVNVLLDYSGRTLCTKEWSEELRIPYSTIHSRIRRGETKPERILSPVKL